MTAATVTAETTGAGIFARAIKVHAETVAYRLAIQGDPRITQAAGDLLDATGTYAALAAGHIHPGSIWPELEHDDEAHAKGLEMAAENVAEWTAELVRVFPACAIGAAPAARDGGEKS